MSKHYFFHPPAKSIARRGSVSAARCLNKLKKVGADVDNCEKIRTFAGVITL